MYASIVVLYDVMEERPGEESFTHRPNPVFSAFIQHRKGCSTDVAGCRYGTHEFAYKIFHINEPNLTEFLPRIKPYFIFMKLF